MPNDSTDLPLRILALGDVVGKPGRKAFAKLYPDLKKKEKIEFCLLNAENAAGGSGLTPNTADELFRAGADVLTTGDHVWRKPEIVQLLADNSRVLRPANYPPGAPGSGSRIFSLPQGGLIGVISLQGRVFMAPIDCPFRSLDREISFLARKTAIIIVDIHAEATSEKAALARYADGRVSAVVGTHTHVPTADAGVFSGGTAFITDLGMCGSLDSILGREPNAIINRFMSGRPHRFPVSSDSSGIQGVVLELDRGSGRALSIRRIEVRLGDHA